MLNRTQLILLTVMATLGGSFAGFLAVGIAMGDITLALINLGVIVALFACAFVIGVSEKPSKPVVDQKTEGTYFSVDWPHEFTLGGKSKRAGDIHVGGELNPEFRTSLSQMIAAQKESGTA